MKKWVSENIFLVDAVVYFLFTIFLFIIAFMNITTWMRVIFWGFIAIALCLRRLKKAKKRYTVDSYGFWVKTILVLVLISVVGNHMKIFEVNTFLYVLLIVGIWKITLFMAIQQLLNHRNYVNGIEVKKYDFWSQDERKKKEQEKREKKERYKNKTEEK
ncbi:hypothetical protein [Filifactor alocis]